MMRVVVGCVTLFQLVFSVHLQASYSSVLPPSLMTTLKAEGHMAVDLKGPIPAVAWQSDEDDSAPVNLYRGDLAGHGTTTHNAAIGAPRAILSRDNSVSIISTFDDEFGTDVIFNVNGRPKSSRHFTHSATRKLAFGYDAQGHGLVLSIQPPAMQAFSDDGKVRPMSLAQIKTLPSEMQAQITY